MRRVFTAKFFKGFVRDFLSIYGVVAVMVTVAPYWSALAPLNSDLKTSDSLVLVTLAALLWASWINRPRNEFEHKLNGKDIRVALVVGNILEQDGAIVVPINTEFDSVLGGSVEKSTSIKAQTIKQYFGGGGTILGDKLQKKLAGPFYKGAKLEDGKTYKMGTTVTIEQNGRTFYFVANSAKINSGRVGSRKEDLVPVLSELWNYLINHGAKGNVAVPLLGTGNGRLPMNRADVFKEIVRSFIASCSEKSYCEKLTIVISPSDVAKSEIDIDALSEFLYVSCVHAIFDSGAGAPLGNPIPVQPGATVLPANPIVE